MRSLLSGQYCRLWRPLLIAHHRFKRFRDSQPLWHIHNDTAIQANPIRQHRITTLITCWFFKKAFNYRPSDIRNTDLPTTKLPRETSNFPITDRFELSTSMLLQWEPWPNRADYQGVEQLPLCEKCACQTSDLTVRQVHTGHRIPVAPARLIAVSGRASDSQL